MNRITQCLHGKGTISIMMTGSQTKEIRPEFLAYSSTSIRPVIFWNLTGRCNLLCSHCYNSSGPDQDADDELNTSEAISFIDDCGALGVPVLLLSGGEPLMRPDIWELAGHAHVLGIKTALSSNGTLITPEIAQKIRDAGIGYVGISLDGATAATHDKFRNSPGAFDRAVQAFSFCKDARIRCGVRVTLTRDNLHELGCLIDLALRIGACRFCVYWLVPSGRGADSYGQLQLSEQEVFSALDLLQQYAKKTDPSVMEFLTVDGPQDAVHLLQWMEQEGSEDLPEAINLVSSMKGGCSAGIRVANITPSGDVYPCQFAQMPEFHIGSIREKRFSEIWNDP
ncbi:MAG: radical SAM protein, partial [Methanospirillum sp.]|uniref:radical SAM protein n=1 Tax=Methanospirillum sp. TaxID=45200 RepID=UPI002375F980